MGARSRPRRIKLYRCVYLIHFDSPIGNHTNSRAQAQHYIGFSDYLPDRLVDHIAGRGAKIMAAVAQRGIGWSVVRTWDGTRHLERILKNKKSARDLCPICQAQKGKKEKSRVFVGLTIPNWNTSPHIASVLAQPI